MFKFKQVPNSLDMFKYRACHALLEPSGFEGDAIGRVLTPAARYNQLLWAKQARNLFFTSGFLPGVPTAGAGDTTQAVSQTPLAMIWNRACASNWLRLRG
jgi:enamine deaminase RidA (YjgF/YER057c/UK114 family)